MNRRHLQFLLRLLSQPTAPFRESAVLDFARNTLATSRVPHFTDPAGNIVVGCETANDYRRLLRQKSSEPVRLFIAHTDHPGFHGLRWLSPTRLLAQWHGGSPMKHLPGSRVWIRAETGLVDGRIRSAKLLPSRHAIDRLEIETRALPQQLADGLYGGFRFRAPAWLSGKRLYTQVADDLVGVFAILVTAREHFRRKTRAPFLGLLTRAEEVGFIGAIAHFELGWIEARRRPLIAVSLETSRTLANAHIGKGPVVRLGDRRTIFDPGALQVLSQLAEELLPGRHQRRVMDGGTCEATAAMAWGVPAIGISVPLGNYHNQGFEGGPDCRDKEGPAPEFVHLDDIDGLLRLCAGLLQPGLAWGAPWKELHTRLRNNLGRYRRLLEEGKPSRH